MNTITEPKEESFAEKRERLRMEQRLIPGILAGLGMGVAGAIVWGIITITTGFQIGYLALAIGAAVGFTIRKTGKGIDPIFGYWGAGIALFSVMLGNFFSAMGFLAGSVGLGYAETLLRFDYGYLLAIMQETFSPMDLVFYGIAVYEGYKFSFREII